jgi:hypothetical protein
MTEIHRCTCPAPSLRGQNREPPIDAHERRQRILIPDNHDDFGGHVNALKILRTARDEGEGIFSSARTNDLKKNSGCHAPIRAAAHLSAAWQLTLRSIVRL